MNKEIMPLQMFSFYFQLEIMEFY